MKKILILALFASLITIAASSAENGSTTASSIDTNSGDTLTEATDPQDDEQLIRRMMIKDAKLIGVVFGNTLDASS